MVSDVLTHCGALQFMRRMRSLPPERGGSIPSIAVTGYYEDFAAHAALEAGFSAYLTKPVRLDVRFRPLVRCRLVTPSRS